MLGCHCVHRPLLRRPVAAGGLAMCQEVVRRLYCKLKIEKPTHIRMRFHTRILQLVNQTK